MKVTVNKVEIEKVSVVTADRPRAELIYTIYDYGGKQNFKVFLYSKLDNSILFNYQSWYDEYKNIISSKSPKFIWKFSRS